MCSEEKIPKRMPLPFAQHGDVRGCAGCGAHRSDAANRRCAGRLTYRRTQRVGRTGGRMLRERCSRLRMGEFDMQAPASCMRSATMRCPGASHGGAPANAGCRLHRLKSDELWFHHSGSPLDVRRRRSTAAHSRRSLFLTEAIRSTLCAPALARRPSFPRSSWCLPATGLGRPWRRAAPRTSPWCRAR